VIFIVIFRLNPPDLAPSRCFVFAGEKFFPKKNTKLSLVLVVFVLFAGYLVYWNGHSVLLWLSGYKLNLPCLSLLNWPRNT